VGAVKVYVRDTFRCGVLHLHTVKINVCEACPVTTKEERSLAQDICHYLRQVPRSAPRRASR